jgi:hypothetical protein
VVKKLKDNIMKNLAILVLTASFIAACSSGEGGSNTATLLTEADVKLVNPNGYTEEQIRADWDIPQWPEATHADYDTVKGVDDDGLAGVRDDWEIMNAIASYPDTKEFNLLNNAAKLNNQMIDAYEENDKDKMLKIFDDFKMTSVCHARKYGRNNKFLLYSPKKDTPKRKENHKKWSKMLNHYLGPIELPSYSELERKCPLLMSGIR